MNQKSPLPKLLLPAIAYPRKAEAVNPVSHTRFIVGCITVLSAIAMGLGFWLLKLGYQSGELLVTNGGVGGISGLVGFLGGKAVMDKPSVNAGGDVNVNPPPTEAAPHIQPIIAAAP